MLHPKCNKYPSFHKVTDDKNCLGALLLVFIDFYVVSLFMTAARLGCHLFYSYFSSCRWVEDSFSLRWTIKFLFSILFYSMISAEFHRCVPNRIHLLVHSNTLQYSTLIVWRANFLKTVSQIAHCRSALIRSDNSKHCPLWIFTTCQESDHKIQYWGQQTWQFIKHIKPNTVYTNIVALNAKTCC